MFLFFKHNNYITRLKIWFLITFTSKNNLLSVHHARINMDFEDFPISSSLSAITVLATVTRIDAFSLTLTICAHGLQMLQHTGT